MKHLLKSFKIILLILITSSLTNAQNNIQLEHWYIGNSDIDFNTPIGNTYSTAALPVSAGIDGATNGIYDDNGGIIFYTENNIVYTNNGANAGLLNVLPNEVVIESCIVPTPGECDKYWVIYSTYKNSAPYAGIRYTKIKIDSQLPVIISHHAINLYCSNPLRAGFAVSNNIVDQLGNRWLYTVAGTNSSNGSYCGSVDKYKITSTGIQFETNIMSGSQHHLEYTPLEVELSHDGTMLAWGSWSEEHSVYIVNLNASGNYSNHVDLDGFTYNAFGTPLEFSPDNNRLFFSRLGTGIGYIDLNSSYAITVLCGSGCQYYLNHKGNFLELANDGLIYSAGQTECISIDPISGVIGSKVLNVQPKFVTLGHTYAILPDQIDGFDLDAYRRENLCCLYAHTFDDIPGISWLSATWTPISNPFAQQATVHLYNDLIIEPGVEIIIQDMTFWFGPNAKVIVKPGGKLILDNTIFTSIEDCKLIWPGVEVWGDPTKTQDTWNTNGLNTHQGMIKVMNYSHINNAYTAIAAIALNPDGSYDWSKAGGIIQVENSGFKNNRVGIWIGGYSNFQPNNHTRTTRRFNRSYITSCEFVTDDDFYGIMNFQYFVALWDGSGINIQGNNFENVATVPWSKKGTGIIAIQFPITVIPLCTSGTVPCSNFKTNNFVGLLRGIDASSIFPGNRIVISDCIFLSNYRGITLTNTTKSEITENNIRLPAWDPAVGYPFGLYLSRCKDYHVEANFISGFNQLKTHGIIVHNSGPDNNEIYRNTFRYLNYGIKPQLSNRGITTNGTQTGLCLLCNDFTTNTDYYDIQVVASNHISKHKGIAFNQMIRIPGAQNFPYYNPADNQFSNSHTSGTYDFENSDGDYLYYSHANNVTSPSIIRYKPVWSAHIGLNYLPPFGVRCPSKLPTNPTLSLLYSDMNSAQVAVNSSKLLVDIWVDGGNINLGDEVETTSSWDAYQQFNELMGMSPYISEEVLISMINNPVFTALMVKLVCVANPQASRNDAVLDALYNRTPAMPEEYIDDILAERDSYSPLDELRANAGADYHWLRTIQKEIIGMYRTDSLMEGNPAYYDSLILFLARMPGLTGKYELALTFLEFGDFEAMRKTLDSIPFSFELSEIENQEYLNNLITYGIAREIAEDSLVPGQLSQIHISNLSDILEQEIGNSHEMALALLKWNDPGYTFDEIILDYVPQQQRKIKKSKKATDPKLDVYPNPAREYCTVAYIIPETQKGRLAIILTDINGREVYRSQPTQYTGEMMIDLKGLKSGVYSVSLVSNRTILTMKRLVIIK